MVTKRTIRIRARRERERERERVVVVTAAREKLLSFLFLCARLRVFFQKKVRSIKSVFCFVSFDFGERRRGGRDLPGCGKKEVPFAR